MFKIHPSHGADLLRAFYTYEEQVRVTNTKVGCLLVVTLMPAGTFLDYFVYPGQLWLFFKARLLCAAMAAVICGSLYTEVGKKSVKWLSIVMFLLPACFIAWMIYATEGAGSPYYAGLNLVLLAVSVIIHWTVWESILWAVAIILMYLSACVLNGSRFDSGVFFNNLYFLVLTGIIVVTGNHFFNRLRFNEFALRFELDRNRQLLEESNEKLEESNRKLEESNKRLVELDQVKSRFFANISHELRTPLTLLLAPLETLLHRWGHELTAGTRGLLGTMHANGMRLLKLINDLLDLVRLELGRMEVRREPVAIAEFARGLSNSVLRVAEAKGLKLETLVEDRLGSILADHDKLEKIVLNLLFNAIKFTPAGGLVNFSVKRDAEELVLQVADTGVGIAETDLPYVFDRFWQADASSRRKHQGAGIGLALVKELVEAQGGTVSVTSQVDGGTTITVRLPYARVEAASLAASDPDSEKTEEWLANLSRRAELYPTIAPLREPVSSVERPANGSRPRVLIAEDEPDMLHFLRSQLSAHFQVLEAVSGQQAIDMASQSLPDVILLDMMMPEKDGLEVCRELRGGASTRSIPIVLLTARADEATKLAALSAGASDFLTKPFSTTEVYLRLKNQVESCRLQRKLAWQNQLLEGTIEQLKGTETQLMASLGRLSAGIIHEINNPLSYANTALYALKRKVGSFSEEQKTDSEEILRDIEDGINRVKNIVLDLRTVTHPNTERCDIVEVHAIVSSALRCLRYQWKDKVRIEAEIANTQTVWGNQSKLIQVLINLLQNALDALRRKTFVNEQPTIWIEGRVKDNTHVLTIRDNGEGIGSEHLSKVFDPFFTTKGVGEGMGLGLSICHQIIEQHGGRISVRSEPGRCCEFTVELPTKAPNPS